MQASFRVRTRGAGLYEITREVADWLPPVDGLLVLMVRHTSCGLLIQENADPDVRRDLDEFFRRLVPPADSAASSWMRHQSEGPDDMPAHIKAALTPVSLSIPVQAGRMRLGTWQGIYLAEYRAAPHHRGIAAHFRADD